MSRIEVVLDLKPQKSTILLTKCATQFYEFIICLTLQTWQRCHVYKFTFCSLGQTNAHNCSTRTAVSQYWQSRSWPKHRKIFP